MTWNGSSYGGSNAYYSPSHPLNYMMVETWDDYEEGTEIETGISNCLSGSSFQLTLAPPSQLTWQYSFIDFAEAPFGSDDTVDHYTLYYSTNSVNFSIKDANIAGNCSQSGSTVTCPGTNLSSYSWSPGTYTLYVQAAGKAGLSNSLSNNAVTYVVE